mgnify:FL=1
MKSLIIIAIAFFGFSSALILQAEESFIPDPPSLNSSNYILIDFATNRILAEKGSEERMEPASLTKIMTGYVVADQVSEGFINIDDEVVISENCWRKGGSRMFIAEGSKVFLLDLIKGMVIQSGNDASCAIAEHVAGSEENFVKLMMKYASSLGLTDSNFINPTGWPDIENYSSAKDLATISRNLISGFPEHYSLYRVKSYTYNDIKQRNRNGLLWQDDSIDGLKTGHTETAGYCMVSSAARDETRLIAVTLNSSSEKTRLTDNRRLLDYGFRYFKTKKILSAGEILKENKIQVWGGQKESADIAPDDDLYVTLPARDFKRVESILVLNNYVQAPLKEGQVVGKVVLKLDNKEINKVNLVSLERVESQGLFGRAWSNIQLIVHRFLMEES